METVAVAPFSCWVCSDPDCPRQIRSDIVPFVSQSHLQLLGRSDERARPSRGLRNIGYVVAIPRSVAGLFGPELVASHPSRYVAIPPSAAGLFGAIVISCVVGLVASQSHLQLLGCSDASFKSYVIPGTSVVAIPPSVAGLFGHGQLRARQLFPGRNPTFSCWAVRTIVSVLRTTVRGVTESQSHLQLLGCSDRVVRAAGRLALSPSTSQSHLQLLGCSDVQQLTMQLGQDFKSQSHLQLLGCSDGQSFHRHRDARQRVAIPPSVAGLFGPTWSASLPTQAAPTACRNPTFSCWAVRTLVIVAVVVIGGLGVAIPPSVAGLFGHVYSKHGVYRLGQSQSHLQLLGCSDENTCLASNGLGWPCRNPTFSCWAVRTVVFCGCHSGPTDGGVAIPPSVAGLFGLVLRGRFMIALYGRKSQSRLQLLGCSDGIWMIDLHDNYNLSQSHLQLLGCSDGSECGGEARKITESQSHLQLLGCSD